MTSYKNYLLTVLLVVLAFNYADRFALGLVLQDVKIDLHLSDTQLGVLTGFAFALFYSVMGIPIARWADRGNRVTIIGLTTALWSAAVALCGLSATFLQLLFIRIGVAVGEAGCLPPAHSLIADHFDRVERPRAVARYMLGGSLSVVIGYFFAGWVNQFYGWRTTFIILGLPGLVLSALVVSTLRESRRGKPASSEALLEPSLNEVRLRLWGSTTFRHLLVCFAVTSFFGYGISQWQPAFFIRSYGLETGVLGTWFAVIYCLGSSIGIYIGGEWASRHAAGDEALQLQASGAVYASMGVISPLIYISGNRYVAFCAMGLVAVCGATITGPLFAAIQTLVPPRMRAVSIAFLYLFANLIGMGLGPFAAGTMSDAFRSWAGNESLRYALLALCPGYLWGGWHLWRASKTVARELV